MSGQLLLDYATEPSVPGATFLPAGQFEFHVHAEQTAGNQSVQLYAEFWEYDPNSGLHVAMIGQTQTSKVLTSTETEYRLFFTTQNVYTFVSSQSRISVHLHVLVGGTGGANVTAFVGGQADSHVTIPLSLSNLSPTGAITLTPVAITSFANAWRPYQGGGTAWSNPVQYTVDESGICRLNGLVDKNGGSFIAQELICQIPVSLAGNWPIFASAMNGGSNSAGTGQLRAEYAGGGITNVKLGDIGGPVNPVNWVSLDPVWWRTK